MAPRRWHRVGSWGGGGTSDGRRTPPLLVEVIGIAGAGKSTLAQLLCEDDDTYRLAEFIHTRRPAHLLHVVHSLPCLMPVLLSNLVRRPRLSWADFKLMVYVTEWRSLLLRKSEYRTGVTLLDQGPIYALVRLKAQGRGVSAGRPFQRWWKNMMMLWADTLFAVVWLDAPDAVLRSRIEERAQAHAVKGEPVEIGQQFITRYRALFDEMFRHIELPGGPGLFRFDTKDVTADQVAAGIRSALSAHSQS